MKIAFVHNALREYRESVFIKFSERNDVHFILTTDPKITDLNQVVFLPRLKILDYIIAPGVLRELERINPDVVVTTDATFFISHAVNYFCRKNRIPYVVWQEQWSPNFHPRHVLMRSLERKTIYQANVVFALGSKAATYARNLGARNIVLAYNTCSITHSTNKASDLFPEIGQGVPTLLFLGRIERVKGLSTLLKALKILKESNALNFRVIVAGYGSKLTSVKTLALSYELSEVVFLDKVINRQEKSELLNKSTVVILPSQRWWAVEAWGLVLNEALSSGRFIIASSQTGGEADLISDPRDGLTFSAGKSKQLADKLKIAFSGKHTEQEQEERRARYLSKFNEEQLLEQLEYACTLAMLSITGPEQVPTDVH